MVYELHGSTLRNYCTKLGKFYDVILSQTAPVCPAVPRAHRPDVLYEEGLTRLSGAVDAIRHADTLIIGGTSLVVYPAAGLIRYFRGDNLVVINICLCRPVHRKAHRAGAERGHLAGLIFAL